MLEIDLYMHLILFHSKDQLRKYGISRNYLKYMAGLITFEQHVQIENIKLQKPVENKEATAPKSS